MTRVTHESSQPYGQMLTMFLDFVSCVLISSQTLLWRIRHPVHNAIGIGVTDTLSRPAKWGKSRRPPKSDPVDPQNQIGSIFWRSFENGFPFFPNCWPRRIGFRSFQMVFRSFLTVDLTLSFSVPSKMGFCSSQNAFDIVISAAVGKCCPADRYPTRRRGIGVVTGLAVTTYSFTWLVQNVSKK